MFGKSFQVVPADGTDTPRSIRDLLAAEHILWTVDDVAAKVGVTPRKIWHLIYDGELGPTRKLGRRRVIHVDVLAAWIEGLPEETFPKETHPGGGAGTGPSGPGGTGPGRTEHEACTPTRAPEGSGRSGSAGAAELRGSAAPAQTPEVAA